MTLFHRVWWGRAAAALLSCWALPALAQEPETVADSVSVLMVALRGLEEDGLLDLTERIWIPTGDSHGVARFPPEKAARLADSLPSLRETFNTRAVRLCDELPAFPGGNCPIQDDGFILRGLEVIKPRLGGNVRVSVLRANAIVVWWVLIERSNGEWVYRGVQATMVS